MTAQTICRLSLEGYGLTPTDFWIEARKLSKGFSVMVFIDDHLLRPKRLFVTKREFSTTRFAEYLQKQSEICFEDHDAWEQLSVDGVNGLEAISLKLALLGDCYTENDTPVSEWLNSQNKASKQFIEANIDLNNKDNLHWLCDLVSNAETVTDRINITDYLDRYHLTYSADSLESLYSLLSEEAEKIQDVLDQERTLSRQKENAEREAKLAPYLDKIKSIANEYDDFSPHAAGSYNSPSKRAVMTKWLENYILAHNALPSGEHEVEWPYFGGTKSLGKVDFSV